MNKKEYRNEGLDFRRLSLYFKTRIWIVLLLAVIGGGLGALTYQVVKSVYMPIEYKAESKLYIVFATDPTGEVYQYYNGYTWNDLIHSDMIMDCIMVFAPDYDKDEIREWIEASIISDIRVLTVTVKGDNEKEVREIQYAVEQGLVAYSVIADQLFSVTTIRSVAPERVYWEDRTVSSGIIGAVIFALCTFAFYFVGFITDDAIYVQSDLEKRYGYKALGVMPRSQKGLQPYFQELKAGILHEVMSSRKFVFVDLDDHCDLKAQDFERMLNWQEGGSLDNFKDVSGQMLWHIMDEEDDGLFLSESKEKEWLIYPFNSEGMCEESAELIRNVGGIFILIPFGVGAASRKLERVLTFLKNQDLNVYGIIISDADEDYLMRYFT